MSQNKILFTLTGLLAAIYAINKVTEEKTLQENFLDVPSTSKVQLSLNDGALSQNAQSKLLYNPQMDGKMFQTDAKLQMMLEPRGQASVPALSKIVYKPDPANMAVSPDQFASMAVEGYQAPAQSCKASSGSMAVNADHQGDLPSNGMENPEDVFVVSRLVHANKKSRLQSLGCPFRGDLPITPRTTTEDSWFVPSSTPSIDLREGALQAMGGFDIENAQAMQTLKYVGSGGAQSTYSGSVMDQNMMQGGSIHGSLSDVSVAGFH